MNDINNDIIMYGLCLHISLISLTDMLIKKDGQEINEEYNKSNLIKEIKEIERQAVADFFTDNGVDVEISEINEERLKIIIKNIEDSNKKRRLEKKLQKEINQIEEVTLLAMIKKYML